MVMVECRMLGGFQLCNGAWCLQLCQGVWGVQLDGSEHLGQDVGGVQVAEVIGLCHGASRVSW